MKTVSIQIFKKVQKQCLLVVLLNPVLLYLL